MKIAVITDDGNTISQHFGRAQYYRVLTIQDGKIIQSEMRSKLGHQHFQSAEVDNVHSHEASHSGAESHSKHLSMAEVISDCQVLLCGGMGRGAYNSMLQLGITPLVTDHREIDAAVQAYLAHSLINHTELLH